MGTNAADILYARIAHALSRDFACDASCFSRDEVHIDVARDVPGRRRRRPRPAELDLATMGRGVAVSCSPERLAWARATFGGMKRDDVFSPLGVWLLHEYLTYEGQSLYGPHLNFVCANDALRMAAPSRGVAVDLVDLDGIADLFAEPGFRFSFVYDPHGAHPLVLATAARAKGHLVGLAAASADCEELWQVAVEIAPEWQGLGLAKALVSRLAAAVHDTGRLPFYATSMSNVRSVSVATSIGFRLAWVEMSAV